MRRIISLLLIVLIVGMGIISCDDSNGKRGIDEDASVNDIISGEVVPGPKLDESNTMDKSEIKNDSGESISKDDIVILTQYGMNTIAVKCGMINSDNDMKIGEFGDPNSDWWYKSESLEPPIGEGFAKYEEPFKFIDESYNYSFDAGYLYYKYTKDSITISVKFKTGDKYFLVGVMNKITDDGIEIDKCYLNGKEIQ